MFYLILILLIKKFLTWQRYKPSSPTRCTATALHPRLFSGLPVTGNPHRVPLPGPDIAMLLIYGLMKQHDGERATTRFVERIFESGKSSCSSARKCPSARRIPPRINEKEIGIRNPFCEKRISLRPGPRRVAWRATVIGGCTTLLRDSIEEDELTFPERIDGAACSGERWVMPRALSILGEISLQEEAFPGRKLTSSVGNFLFFFRSDEEKWKSPGNWPAREESCFGALKSRANPHIKRRDRRPSVKPRWSHPSRENPVPEWEMRLILQFAEETAGKPIAPAPRKVLHPTLGILMSLRRRLIFSGLVSNISPRPSPPLPHLKTVNLKNRPQYITENLADFRNCFR